MGPKLSVSVRKAGVSAMDMFPRTDVVDYPGFTTALRRNKRSGRLLPRASAHAAPLAGFWYGFWGGFQISTLAPSSTTRFMGRLKKSVDVAALVTIQAKIASRQCGMPDRPLGRAIIRVTK
jgi:hypothetical protein